ncbi:hypothetical protein BH10ACT9_BH10ACT9_47020 [soil metagenome]
MTSLTKPPAPRGAVVLEWSMAAAALVGGLGVAFAGWTYGLTNVTGVGAGFFPLVAGILIALSGALWTVQLFLARKADALVSAEPVLDAGHEIDEEAEESEFPDRAGCVRVGIIAAAILIAALALPFVGYTLTMTLMLATVLFFVSKRPWWLSLVIGIGAAVVSRLVFEDWLGTELPSSTIELIARLGL